MLYLFQGALHDNSESTCGSQSSGWEPLDRQCNKFQFHVPSKKSNSNSKHVDEQLLLSCSIWSSLKK